MVATRSCSTVGAGGGPAGLAGADEAGGALSPHPDNASTAMSGTRYARRFCRKYGITPWLAIGKFAIDTLVLLLNPRVWLIAGILTAGGYIAGRIEGRSVCNERIATAKAAGAAAQRELDAKAKDFTDKTDKKLTAELEAESKLMEIEIEKLRTELAKNPDCVWSDDERSRL
jgi:hypothetical protein